MMETKLEQTYKQNSQELKQYIQSRVKTYEEAEDILQDVFLSAYESLNVLEPVENLLGWLYTTARNKIIDWYRKKKEINFTEIANLSIDDIFEQITIDPAIHYSKKELMELVWEAIDSLPHEQKMVFILNAVEGIPFRDIAIIEDISINTLLARKRYAVKALRKKLTKFLNT